MEMVGFARSTPLTATPLADALRLANETVVKLAQAATEAQARAEADLRDMVAERDDERDQRIVAEVDRDRAHGAREVLGKLLVERDALRAQVEAARTYARQALDYGEDCDATDLLAAMDEAKP